MSVRTLRPRSIRCSTGHQQPLVGCGSTDVQVSVPRAPITPSVTAWCRGDSPRSCRGCCRRVGSGTPAVGTPPAASATPVERSPLPTRRGATCSGCPGARLAGRARRDRRRPPRWIGRGIVVLLADRLRGRGVGRTPMEAAANACAGIGSRGIIVGVCRSDDVAVSLNASQGTWGQIRSGSTGESMRHGSVPRLGALGFVCSGAYRGCRGVRGGVPRRCPRCPPTRRRN